MTSRPQADARTAQLLLDVARSLSRHRTVESVAASVAAAVPPLVGAARSAFAVLDPDTHVVTLVGRSGWPAHLADRVDAYATSPQESPELAALLRGRAPAMLTASGSPWARGMLAEFEVQALAAVPVLDQDDVLGLVLAHWDADAPTTLDDVVTERLAGLAGLAAVALENARLLEQIRHQALHDSLTGLPNRALLTELLGAALDDARRAGGQVGLLLCDVDRFKRVNDGLGHTAGDELLRRVADVLRDLAGGRDVVCRYSGDQFAVLLPDARSDADLRDLVRRVRARLAEPITVAGQPVFVDMVFGSTLGEGRAHDDAEVAPTERARRLLARATEALDRGKARTRNLPTPSADGVDRLRLEADLHDAASRGELVVHYQPQVDARSGATVALEALVRWRHPELGLVPPSVFIPIAEESGAIVDIGAHVLAEACSTVADWPAQGRPLQVAVNVSAAQLHSPGFSDLVRFVLRRTGLAPERLVLEVTESQVVSDATADTHLRALRALGVDVSIDDFGTGYSSLAQLRRLPVTEVKIDQSFTAELPQSAPFIAGIIALAHGLGLRVVAEGVEQADQLDALVDAGCDRVQGYLLGRPTAPADVVTADVVPWTRPDEPLAAVGGPGHAGAADAAVQAWDASAFPDFATAAREVLRDLRNRVGMRLWLVTRASGEHQVVLEAEDAPDGYGVTAGTVLSWDGSLCAAMVTHHGPYVAPRVADVPALAAAPNRRDVPIEAYIGVPLLRPDGEVFGTLCAFDPEPQPASLTDAEDLVVLQARLLSTVLRLELAAEAMRRRAERAEADAGNDALTQVGNRRGWDHMLAAEEERCRRYGHSACVLVIDVDRLKAVNDSEGHAAGDELLRTCARVLSTSVRSTDYVARLGGDEFAVLAVEIGGAEGEVELERIRRRLRDAGVRASVGLGVRDPDGGLPRAQERADQAMYADKVATRSALDRAAPA